LSFRKAAADHRRDRVKRGRTGRFVSSRPISATRRFRILTRERSLGRSSACAPSRRKGVPHRARSPMQGLGVQQYRQASNLRSVSAALCKLATLAWLIAVLIAVGWLLPAAAGHAADVPATSPTWRAEKEVFYLIFVRSFADSNGDHIGDFQGIERKLPYLQALGVTSILLTPIVPSPMYHNYFASRFDDVDRGYGDRRRQTSTQSSCGDRKSTRLNSSH